MSKSRPSLFKPGNKLGKGRPAVLLPEVQRAIETNKNAVKVLILDELNRLEGGVPRIKKLIRQCIDKIEEEGNPDKLRTLLEIALGKLVTDPPEFPLDPDEKALVIEYRRRKNEGNGSPGPISS